MREKILHPFKKLKNFFDFVAPGVDGLTVEEYESLFIKNPLSKYIMPEAYDDELGFFFCKDNTVGLAYELSALLVLSDNSLLALYNGIFKEDFPEDTLVQFILWASEYIEPLLKRYIELRPPDKRWLAERYADFYRKHIWEGFYPDWQCPVRDFRLFFTVKLPYSMEEYFKKKKDLYYLKERIESTLRTALLAPTQVSPDKLIKLYYLVFNPGHEKRREEHLYYNPSREIYRQCIMGDTLLEQRDRYIRLDGIYGKAITVGNYSKKLESTKLKEIIGSYMGNSAEQINTPFLYALCARKATAKERSSIYTKDAATPKRGTSSSSFSSFFKKHAERVEEIVYAANKLSEEETLWKACLIWYLYHPDYEHLVRSVNTFIHFAQRIGLTLQEEIANLPLFLACTPLNLVHPVLNGAARVNGKRKKTFSFGRAVTFFPHNCAHAAPVQADWPGTTTALLPFVGRLGQVAFIDLWDTNQGRNAVITAPMGSGKSFIANHIAAHYWSVNAYVRIIDVGRSYLPICELLKGQFIEIDPANPVSFNPFSEVKNLELEMDFLVTIVAKMIKPTDPVSDREKGIIERTIKMTFDKYGNETDITKIRDTLLQMHEVEQDKLFREMALDHLAPWVKGGQYGRLVNGKNQIDFDNPFVVFEMGKVESHQNLKSVVLLIAFYHLTKEIYEGDESVRKVIIWDEAWRYSYDQVALYQIERAAREYRKYNGSLIVITQLISDFERNEATKAVVENSDFVFLLQQKPGTIKEMEKEKRFGLSPFEYKLLGSLNTQKGKYSEIFCITNRNGTWVTRFVVPPDIYFLYTTDPQDKTLRNIFIEAGWPIERIIEKCKEIKVNRDLWEFWQAVVQRKTQGETVDLNAVLEEERRFRCQT